MKIEIRRDIAADLKETAHDTLNQAVVLEANRIEFESAPSIEPSGNDSFDTLMNELPSYWAENISLLKAHWIEYTYLSYALNPHQKNISHDDAESYWATEFPARMDAYLRDMQKVEGLKKEALLFSTPWSSDNRGLHDILRAWAERHEMSWGINRWLAERLGASERTVAGWLQGRGSRCEPLIRKAMESFDLQKCSEIWARINRLKAEYEPSQRRPRTVEE